MSIADEFRAFIAEKLAKRGGAAGQPAEEVADTPKVNRTAINFHFVKTETEYTYDPTTKKLVKGSDKIVRGNFMAFVPESFQGYFDIPVFSGTLDKTATGVPKLIEVPETAYEMHLDATGTNKTVVVRRKHKRVKTAKKAARRTKGILLPLPNQKTSKGNTRWVSFGFPEFFTIPMIMQAVATMCEDSNPDKKPLAFKMKGTGSTYTIPYGIGKTVPADWDSGAWHSDTWGPEDNLDNIDKVYGNVGMVTAAG
jgi:hypothetical protein